MDNREEAQRLYTEALQETDPQRRAELYAEADWLMEDEGLLPSEEEVTEEELAAHAAGIPWDEIDEDDEIEFTPDPDMLREGGDREVAG